jgi:major membrane immunogen (membrane-anchored lipoprotein)
MKRPRIVMVLLFLLGACGCHDRENRSRIVGTWNQGTPSSSGGFTITFSPDGTYSSRYPGHWKGQAMTFDGKWKIEWGNLIITDCHSNSISISDTDSLKITGIDNGKMDLIRNQCDYTYYKE